MSYDVMIQQSSKDIATSREFGLIVQEIAMLEQQVPSIKVKDDAGEVAASEARARVKTCSKQLEEYRKTAKAPYLKINKVIDSMFKPLKEACERMTETLDTQIAPYKSAKIAAAEAAQKQAMEEALTAKEAGVDVSTPAEVKPVTVTDTDSGKTYLRKVKKVEIVDPIKLVKAAMDNRNKVPFDVIQFNESKLRQVAVGDTYKPKQWAKYGVRVYEVDEVATRT